MADKATSPLLRAVRVMAEDPRLRDAPDQELLRRCSCGNDEAAFLALIKRYGPMVLCVCREVLGHEADAEDSFQATFLALARKAGTIRRTTSVASWLYGVARRVALKARSQRTRRQKYEARPTPEAPGVFDDVSWREVREVIHGELSGISETFRAVLVLCYLSGKTRAEAAAILGVSKATVKSRLEHGRALLRARLERRGLGPTTALAVAAWPGAGTTFVPTPLVQSAAKAASGPAAGQAAAAAVPDRVTVLAEGVLKMMNATKTGLTVGVLIAAVALGTGVGVLAWGQAGNEPGARERGAPKAAADGDKGSAPAPAVRPLALAEAAAREVEESEQRARVLILVAEAQAKSGDRAAARRTLQQAFHVADALPNNDNDEFYVRLSVLGRLASAQAEAGAVEAANQTIGVMRIPKVERLEGVYVIDPELLENNRAAARVQIAVAQARAGKVKEAEETVGRIDEMRREGFGAPALADIAAAHARAGEWGRAEEMVRAIKNEAFRVPAWIELAKLHARAGRASGAGAAIAEALRAVPEEAPGDTVGKARRAAGLQLVALAQAELGDRAAALGTAESIPDLEPVGDAKILQFPYRAMTLVRLRTQAGDIERAKKAAEDIDADFQGGSTRAYAMRLIAEAQARAGDGRGALETAGAIAAPFHKAAAHAEVARAHALAGDRVAAAATFAKALELADAVPETADKSYGDRDSLRPALLRALAAAQAEVGQDKAARDWIAKLSSPYLRACGWVGLSEGGAARQASTGRGNLEKK